MGNKRKRASVTKKTRNESSSPAEGKKPPPYRADEIAEELLADLAPVLWLVFLIDGRRFVFDKNSFMHSPKEPGWIDKTPILNPEDALTYEEFEKKYSRTVQQHVHAAGERKIRNLERSTGLVDANSIVSEITYAVGSENKYVFQEYVETFDDTQPALYVRRKNGELIYQEKSPDWEHLDEGGK